jgi:hypothetical protein
MPSSVRFPVGAAVAGLLAALPLTACSGTTSATGCSGTTCSVTLQGSGSEVDVLGQHLAFAGTQGDRATLSVGDRSVSCAQGQSLDAGPLTLTCSEVTADSVKLTASLG